MATNVPNLSAHDQTSRAGEPDVRSGRPELPPHIHAQHISGAGRKDVAGTQNDNATSLADGPVLSWDIEKASSGGVEHDGLEALSHRLDH